MFLNNSWCAFGPFLLAAFLSTTIQLCYAKRLACN
jgi:hypothetical protein